jgi:hypothetical protein
LSIRRALTTPATLSSRIASGNSNATPNSSIMPVTNETYRVISRVVVMSALAKSSRNSRPKATTQ